MNATRLEKLKKLMNEQGSLVRTNVLREARFCSKDVTSLVDDGILIKVRTGYYALPDIYRNMSEFEVAAAVIPSGVIAFLSAANYHGITSRHPISIDVVIPSNCRSPILPTVPSIAISRSVKEIYVIGIECVNFQHGVVRIYNKERTVCDLFRQRRQVGEDIALDALKSYMSGSRNLQQLFDYATRLQVKAILAPYVEALL